MIITMEELSRSIRKTLQIKQEVNVYLGDYKAMPSCTCGNADDHLIMGWETDDSSISGKIIFHDDDLTVMDYTIDSGSVQ